MKPASEIRKLLMGLRFISESDFPFCVHNEQEFALVDEVDFMRRLVNMDSRFYKAVAWINGNLTDVKVSKMGSIKVAYEISGVTREGKLLRISTFGVET